MVGSGKWEEEVYRISEAILAGVQYKQPFRTRSVICGTTSNEKLIEGLVIS